jgi:hypothetical protein
MFCFGRQKERVSVQAILRRVIDASSPNLPPYEGELRGDSRVNRSFPVVLAPWVDDQACAADAITALTKNLSDQGLTVLHTATIAADQLVVGFWLESQEYFFLGDVRHRTPLGGGIMQLGIEMNRRLTPLDEPSLEDLQAMTASLTGD